MVLKKCFKCGEEKDLSEFYKHPGMSDGRLGKCKECTKKDVRENTKANKTYYKLYDAKRNNYGDRKKYINNRNKKVQTDEERIKSNNVKKQWATRNREKARAELKAIRLKKAGKLSLGKCFFCGTSENVEFHHPDYTHEHMVVCLCKKCHESVHKLERLKELIINAPMDSVMSFEG